MYTLRSLYIEYYVDLGRNPEPNDNIFRLYSFTSFRKSQLQKSNHCCSSTCSGTMPSCILVAYATHCEGARTRNG